MNHQDSPTPPAPAEVCARLKRLANHHSSEEQFCDDRRGTMIKFHHEATATLTAALLLIEQGEKERERVKQCLQAANYGDVPKGWDDAIDRAERAEEQLAAATERVKQLERKAQYFAYLIGTGRCPVITKWDGVERHGYVSCIGVSAKAFEHALELAAQKLADIAAREQPTPESK